MVSEAARIALQALLQEGYLIPVEITMDCDNLDHGYCLTDGYTVHSPGESDCFRAELFIVRPNDKLMQDPKVREMYNKIHLDPSWRCDRR